MVADNEIDARADALLPGNALDVLFTSGTTGQPKGVVITHAQNLRTVAEWVARVGLTCEDRYPRGLLAGRMR